MKFSTPLAQARFVFTGAITKLSIGLAAFGFCFAVQAQDIGVVAGYRNDNADGTSGTTVSQKPSFQVGAIAKFEVSEKLLVRSGALYAPRSYTSKPAGGTSTDLKFTYFEVPAGLLYKFSDYGGVFAGAAIGMIISKDCGGSCDSAKVNGSPLAFQFGGSFKIAPQFGFEIYYESLTSKLAEGLENPRSVIANLMVTFD